MAESTFKDRWDFDRWAKSYDEIILKAVQSNDWMYKEYDRILDKVVDYCDLSRNDYSTVVDIGVGTGNLASRFLDRGLRVMGIDPSREMRKICRQKSPNLEVRAGDFLNIPLTAENVDVIISSYAFHHLTPAQKEASIHEMKRVLKPKGRIVIADLMFRNRTKGESIKQALRAAGRGDIVDDIEDEYYGLFDELSNSFQQEGFAFHGEQITPFVWIFCALLTDG
jgi:putative AdoMet-dependent methyltransferase